jgi:deoxyribose-phosphate aldolase
LVVVEQETEKKVAAVPATDSPPSMVFASSAEKKYRGYTLQQIAQTIDHSVLKPDSTYADIEEGAQVAATYHTASLCIRPCDVSRAAAFLAEARVPVCTVIGFPHGTCTTATKARREIE